MILYAVRKINNFHSMILPGSVQSQYTYLITEQMDHLNLFLSWVSDVPELFFFQNGINLARSQVNSCLITTAFSTRKPKTWFLAVSIKSNVSFPGHVKHILKNQLSWNITPSKNLNIFYSIFCFWQTWMVQHIINWRLVQQSNWIWVSTFFCLNCKSMR